MNDRPSVRSHHAFWVAHSLCCGLFLLCALLASPYVQTGIVDDWSIVRTAEVLAATGHVHYNGWEAPILGWPLYVAALAMHLFGHGYTVARFTVIAESLLLLAILQRVMVRCGSSETFACFGALCVAFTPPYFTTSVLFMTDIPGLLAVVCCFYLCLRALQAVTVRAASAWIAVAACAGALLGSTRQIAWLGLFVIVPGCLWLLRHRRLALWWGAGSWCLGGVFVFAVMRWFNRQPYVLPETLFKPHIFSVHSIIPVVRISLRVVLELTLTLCPLCLALWPKIIWDYRAARQAMLCAAAFLLALFIIWGHQNHQSALGPFLLRSSYTDKAEALFLNFPSPVEGLSPTRMPAWFRCC